MPGFNGTGTFVRTYDWTDDKAAAVKITASRFDEEHDGFATGLSSCIVKNGEQTTTAIIPFAQGIKTSDGTAASPTSLTFINDTDSGLYRIGANNLGIALGGVKHVDFASATASFNSAVAIAGALQVAGAVNLGGAATASSTLTVKGAATCESSLVVAGALTMGGAATASSTLTIKGAATCESTLRTVGLLSADGGAYIYGTNTNDDAVTSYVGEYIESITATASAVTLTSTVSANIANITLGRGDWEVQAFLIVSTDANTRVIETNVSVSATSATPNTTVGKFSRHFYGASGLEASGGAGSYLTEVSPVVRVSIAVNTIYYCVVNATFSAGALVGYGGLRARRPR